MRSVQRVKTVVLQAPKDINGIAIGPNVNAVSLRNYNHAVVNILFGNLAANCTIALRQMKDIAGSASKILSFSEIFYIDTDNADAVEQDQAESQVVTADVYTALAASHDRGHFKIEVRPGMLDVTNRFDCIRPLVTGGAGITLVAIWIDLFMGRYTGKENDQRIFPSALSNV